MARTTVAFALAPLWVTAATTAWACYVFPYREQWPWIVIGAFVGTVFAYAGTLVLGVPAYRILSARRHVSPWIAVALGFIIGSGTWIVFFLCFAFSLGNSSLHELSIDLAVWLSILLVGLLGSIVGLTIWVIARPDRDSPGLRPNKRTNK